MARSAAVWWTMQFKEALINSELPAAQGRAAKINDVESLILREKRKPRFSFFSL
jgi:hypothetical protein